MEKGQLEDLGISRPHLSLHDPSASWNSIIPLACGLSLPVYPASGL